MLYWAATFFVIAIVAAFLGYGRSSDVAVVAKVLFVAFLVCAAVSLLFGLFRRRRRAHG
jgi:uncharacterized membrane protein YtjA (UPF0391 family)